MSILPSDGAIIVHPSEHDPQMQIDHSKISFMLLHSPHKGTTVSPKGGGDDICLWVLPIFFKPSVFLILHDL